MTSQPGQWRWDQSVSELDSILDRGGILAIPTESSYGLAVDPCNADGVAALFRCKGRPADKALPVVLGDLLQLTRVGGDPSLPGLQELAQLWPAPLTVIVPIQEPIPASAGGRTLAVRIPSHDRLRVLLHRLGRPLTATSANPAGGSPVSDPSMLIPILSGWPSVVVDDGMLTGGPASTIVQMAEEGYRVLRQGALSSEWLRARVSRPVFSAAAAEILADESPQVP